MNCKCLLQGAVQSIEEAGALIQSKVGSALSAFGTNRRVNKVFKASGLRWPRAEQHRVTLEAKETLGLNIAIKGKY